MTTAIDDIFGPDPGESAPAYLRRRLVRRYFTTERQWQAVVEVVEKADRTVPLGDLQLAVCHARLRTYRSNHA